MQSENIPPEEKQEEEVEKPDNKEDLWDQIGFHKPLAGFWYNIVYQLLGILMSAILMGYLINFFYPFPDSLGMKDIAFGYFSLLFSLFDIGTGAVMSRFIPEVNIKNPKKMMHFLQYFIWYQMMTGIVQTTIVSVYALFFASESTMAYTVWIMLIASTTQYPGFLGVFRNILNSLQYYDKTKLLNFVTGNLMNTFTSFLFVYLFRIWGENNPTIGPILGIAIGAAVGSYVDDFFATLLSAYFFGKAMKPYGIRPKYCFHIDFTWEEIKPVFLYSLRVGTPGFITGMITYVAWVMRIDNIPQITTITFLAIVGGSMGDFFQWFGGAEIGPLISESYMNDKKNLTQYYIGQEIRFDALILGLFVPLILIIRSVMPIVYVHLNMAQYVLAVAFILPFLIRACFGKFFDIPWQVLNGSNRPNFGIFMGFISAGLEVLITYLMFVHFRVQKDASLDELIWYIYFFNLVPKDILLNLITYTFIHKKIIKIKIPLKQIAIGMILPSMITYGALYLVKIAVFDTLYISAGFFPALILTLILVFACLFFVYVPLTGLLGAWDKVNLEEFKKAAIMSGPSRFLVQPLANVLVKVCKISPFHDQFGMSTENVMGEAKSLLKTKKNNREELKEELEQLY
jgi:hypothetical protein